MEIKRVILGLVTFSILGLILFVHINREREKYLDNVNEINNRKISSVLERPFIISCMNNMECPPNSNTVLFNKNRDYEDLQRHLFIDLFSSDSNELMYVPVYNRLTKRRDAFVIISAGIDGNLNTEVTSVDSMYTDNCFESLNLYNKNTSFNPDTLWLIDSATFSIVDVYFGNKDLLLSYFRVPSSLSNETQDISK